MVKQEVSEEEPEDKKEVVVGAGRGAKSAVTD